MTDGLVLDSFRVCQQRLARYVHNIWHMICSDEAVGLPDAGLLIDGNCRTCSSIPGTTVHPVNIQHDDFDGIFVKSYF